MGTTAPLQSAVYNDKLIAAISFVVKSLLASQWFQSSLLYLTHFWDYIDSVTNPETKPEFYHDLSRGIIRQHQLYLTGLSPMIGLSI
jgi:hypothetical protein